MHLVRAVGVIVCLEHITRLVKLSTLARPDDFTASMLEMVTEIVFSLKISFAAASGAIKSQTGQA